VPVLLAAAVALAYWAVLGNGFVYYDDPVYVTENRWVLAGLTWDSLWQAWTTEHGGNWHPLTGMSHMLDCQLFGRAPSGHHATSLLLHVANTILVWLLLGRMTGSTWRSALVAALFGLHPLHVESVAWVSERKDVLSTLFWLLATLAYAGYVRAPGRARLALVAVALAVGLAAKQMLVTLPLTLLLLDYWPLGRLTTGRALWPLIREKIPLLLIAAAACVVTLVVQSRVGAVKPLAMVPFGARVENAIVAYVAYLWKMVWPRWLAVLYPHPLSGLPLWEVAASGLLLVLVTAVAIRERVRRPYLLVGWLWYLGTLVPVIGLVQIGDLAMADRYTYVPLIGIFIAIAWALPAPGGAPLSRFLVPGAVGLALIACLLLTRRQVGFWRDSISLYEHALAVREDNPTMHGNLSAALQLAGRGDEAKAHALRCIELTGTCPDGHQNLAWVLLEEGRIEEAIAHFEEVRRLRPGWAGAEYGLGNALGRLGRDTEAAAHYAEAVRLSPDFQAAHFNLANKLGRLGRDAEAEQHYLEALRLEPDYAGAHHNLATLYLKAGRFEDAARHFREALRLDPLLNEARQGLATAMARRAPGS
jgi:tetratricopeptide (TPR) repeat protein